MINVLGLVTTQEMSNLPKYSISSTESGNFIPTVSGSISPGNVPKIARIPIIQKGAVFDKTD